MSKPGSPGNPNLFCALSQEQLFRKLGSYASGKRRETLANAVATMLSQTGWPVPELQKSWKQNHGFYRSHMSATSGL